MEFEKISSENIKKLKDESQDVIVFNTNFEYDDLISSEKINFNSTKTQQQFQKTNNLLLEASKKLKDGGLFFVYGNPKTLSFNAEYLNNLEVLEDKKLLFKYWIGIEFNPIENINQLPKSHIGLLMYLKTKNKKIPNSFILNTKEIRNPYGICSACKNDLKDWGGKKHLRNKLGAAYSDVWLDNIKNIEDSGEIPEKIVKRIYDLTQKDKFKFTIIKEKDYEIFEYDENKNLKFDSYNITEKDSVILNDSINFMKELKDKYPDGIIDLAFADPPYNLEKDYSSYSDKQKKNDYINWCNKWLKGMYEILKPGGSLMVLNLPQWAIYHNNFLQMEGAKYENWIIWDSLSTPAGKLMPAHYSLLHFSKPGKKTKINLNEIKYIDSREYCSRSKCVKSRKEKGIDEKEILNDIWKDIFRIKHKKDRDSHPCQLPIKLMERIIKLSTDEGDLVYDPFGGAGTTAIAAKLLGRNYIISDIDENYVNISKENLKRVVFKGDLAIYNRESKKRPTKNLIPKKIVEVEYINLCEEKGKILEKDEIKMLNEKLYNNLNLYNGSFKKLQNIVKRKFENKSLIK